MVSHIFITVACLSGFIYALLKEDLYSKIWNGIALLGYGMLIPVMIMGVRIENYVGLSILIFFIGEIGLGVLHLIEKEVSINHKLLMTALAFFGIVPLLSRIMHWPGSGLLSLLAILPIILLFISVLRKRISKNQMLSGIVVFGSLCLINFIRLVSFWVD